MLSTPHSAPMEHQPAPRPGDAYAWYVCVALAFGTFVSVLDRFLMSVLLGSIKADFEISDTQAGLLAGLGFALMYCVLAIPFGRLADLVNRRNMIVIAILAWTLAAAAGAFANSYEQLLIARVAVGVGEAALMPAALSIIATYFAKDQLGRANALFHMGGVFGKATAFIGGGFLLALFTAQGGWSFAGHAFTPWQATFLIVALPGIPVAALILTVREPARPVSSGNVSRLTDVFRYASRHRAAFIWFILSWSCVFSVLHTLTTWSPTFYVRSFALGIAGAATIGGMMGLFGGPIGNFLGGGAADWLEKRGVKGAPALIIMLSLIAAIPAAMLLIFSPVLQWSIAGYAIFTVVALAGGPPGFSAIQRMAPAETRGLAVAVGFSTANMFALGIGPLVVGAFSDTVFAGHPKGLGHSMFASIALFASFGIVAALLSRRPMQAAIADAAGPLPSSPDPLPGEAEGARA